MQSRSVLILMMVLTGCRRNPEESAVSLPAPPPAAALARQGRTLSESLRDLDRELGAALRTHMDGEGEKHMLQAEAITDRLLESRLPFTWLAANSYSLEGYVRQIQALADRIVAEMRSGTDNAAVIQDIADLRRKTILLNRSLALGGGRPPVSLDSLLAGVAPDSTLPSDAGE